MKKVININFHGSVIPIEESSYELLKQYVESLRLYFAQEEGREEIINDIEGRISELFNEQLKQGATCITDEHVQAVIRNIGRPEELEEAELNVDEDEQQAGNAGHTYAGQEYSYYTGSKKLYRDESNKVLGGVCSGIAAYFNIDPVIVRILFVLFGFTFIGILLYLVLWIAVPGSIRLQNGVRKRLFRNPFDRVIAGVCGGLGSYFQIHPWIFRILFLLPVLSLFGSFALWPFDIHFGSGILFPGVVIIYIILWVIVPEAVTTSEKLEMKGEKVDINTIRESVLKEMKDVGERMNRFGKQAGKMAAEKGEELGKSVQPTSSQTYARTENIVSTLLKIILYFIVGVILLSVVFSLIGVAIAAFGLFPVKDFIIENSLQNALAWGTLILFIIVPIIGIITFMVRAITKRRRSRARSWIFWGLYAGGLICFIGLIVSLTGNFQSASQPVEDRILLENPNVNKLIVEANDHSRFNRYGWFHLEPFASWRFDDTVFVNNVRVQIKKAPTDQFEVTVLRYSNGRSRAQATALAEKIPYQAEQNDSLLTLDRAIPINKTDHFRNQYVQVIVAVPVGHQIVVRESLRRGNTVYLGNDSWLHNRYDDNTYGYDYDKTYVMTNTGLEALYPFEENDDHDDDADWETFQGEQQRVIDSIRNAQENQLNRLKDSIREAQRRLRDSLRREADELNRKINEIQANVKRDDPMQYAFMMSL